MRARNFYREMEKRLGNPAEKAGLREELRIGETIRELREKAKLTGAELCRRSGRIDPRTLTAIEKGRIRNPSLESLQAIARGLECLVGDLFSRAEMGFDRNYYRGSQRGTFQMDFPAWGLRLVSFTPPTSQFFCGKLILGAQREIAGDLLTRPSSVFFEVVMGKIEFTVEKERTSLKEGENLFFNGALHHSFRNVLSRESALWLVTVPSFFHS